MKPEFIEMLRRIGDPRLTGLAETMETTAPEVSIRLNPRKAMDIAKSQAANAEVDWWPAGYYLAERPKFTFDPKLHQGRYYVQDASSMIIAAVAKAIAGRLAEETASTQAGSTPESNNAIPLLWLDACAAPGGKTTAALDGLPDGSLVVANEYDYSRAEILKENVAKWGAPATVITRGDTSQYRKLKATFDVIAIDAPCSGEGMMRKDQTAREQWTPALVEECAERQREIIENLWPALRPGGFLVYSTCTFNTVEDEEMVAWIRDEFEAESVDLKALLSPLDGVTTAGIDNEIAIDGVALTYAMRFIPGRTRGEGLFIALLRKAGDFSPAIADCTSKPDKQKKGKPQNKPTANASAINLCKSWIARDSCNDYDVLQSDEGLRIFPHQWSSLLPGFLSKLQVISAGVEAATVKGKDIIPNQELALTTLLSPEAFPTVDLSEKDALLYLSREAVQLPDDAPRGIILLRYDGYPLGFVKNLGNRANNLYPKEWRIRNYPAN
jgi:16S rRNA C967 or C1407 C5-methylase (RsmB/RsmF family)/NOL1/NOP2/fmu family ribosome biogenesis protein